MIIGNIIIKECKLLLSDKRFIVLSTLYIIIISLSVTIFVNDYFRRLDNYSLHLSSDSEGLAAAKRPELLSFFAKGLDAKTSRSFIIWPGGIKVNSNEESVNLLFSLFTTPDLLYVFRVILSLFAILLTYDAIVGEKEKGTLKLVLASSVSRVQIITAKLVSRYIAFLLPLLIVIAVGILTVQIITPASFSTEDSIKIGLFLLFSYLYLLIFFSIGTLISTIARDSSVSLIIAMLVWLMFVFVIPSSCSLIARQIVNFPSAHYMEEQRKAIFVEESFNNEENSNVRIAYRNNQLTRDFNNRFDGYISTFKRISRVSFVTNYVYLVTDLLNTGLAENRNLRDSVIRYQNNVTNKNRNGHSEQHFTYYKLSLAAALQNNLFGLSLIVLINLLLYLLVFYSFMRYDVR